MSASCHFPPAPSPVSMSSLLADGFLPTSNQKLNLNWATAASGAPTYECTYHCSQSWVFPSCLRGLQVLSHTQGQLLHTSSWPSASGYCSHPCFSLLFLCLSLLTITPSWAAVCNFLLSTTGFCGIIFCWFYLSLSHHFLVPFKGSTSTCSSICGSSPILFLAPAVLISLSSDVWCSFHSSL